MSVFFFFFFKQKTAYEMRISDWSSDVCLPIFTPFGFPRGLLLEIVAKAAGHRAATGGVTAGAVKDAMAIAARLLDAAAVATFPSPIIGFLALARRFPVKAAATGRPIEIGRA